MESLKIWQELLTNKFIVILAMSLTSAVEAQKLPKKVFKIGEKSALVEVATNPSQQAKGLMFRTEMGENEGMLFVFPTEKIRSFWMKNTYIALDIGFFDGKKTLIDVQQMEPEQSMVEKPSKAKKPTKSYRSSGKAMYALEMNKGWFKKNNVKKGMKFTLKEPSPKTGQ